MKSKKIKDFPKKPKMVRLVNKGESYGFKCDCNYCRMTRYCDKIKDEAVRLAFLVAETNILENFIEVLKKEGWKDKGLLSNERKNLAFYLAHLDETKSLISDILERKATKLVLKDHKGEEIR